MPRFSGQALKMNDNEPVLCFQHCEEDVNIFCLKVLSVCPVCNKSTSTSPFKIPPFRLPSPFVHSREAPYSILVKPTKGNFLRDYSSTSNLHIGITDGRGVVYDFDEGGVHRSLDGWSQAVGVPVVKRQWRQELGLWNIRLQEHVAYGQWLPQRYSLSENNCYDFVLKFLHLLELDQRDPALGNRIVFCEEKLGPLMAQAAKYITLYREVCQKQAIVQQPVTSTTL